MVLENAIYVSSRNSKPGRLWIVGQFETGLSLECGDLSPLWSAATCRSLGRLNSLAGSGVKPPQAKAVTAGVPGAAAALGWSSHRTPKERQAFETDPPPV